MGAMTRGVNYIYFTGFCGDITNGSLSIIESLGIANGKMIPNTGHAHTKGFKSLFSDSQFYWHKARIPYEITHNRVLSD